MDQQLKKQYQLFLMIFSLFAVVNSFFLGEDPVKGIVTSLGVISLSGSLLLYRLNFSRIQDFFNKIERKKAEVIIVAGSEIITESDEDEKEERFMRVGSQKNRMNKLFTLGVYLMATTFFLSKSFSFFNLSLVTAGAIILRSNTVGQLLFAPMVLISLSLIFFSERFAIGFPFVIMFFFFFLCLSFYSRIGGIDDSLKNMVKPALKAVGLFCLLWFAFSQVLVSNEKLESKVTKQINKVNKFKQRFLPKPNLNPQFAQHLNSSMIKSDSMADSINNFDFSSFPQGDSFQKKLLNEVEQANLQLSQIRDQLGQNQNVTPEDLVAVQRSLHRLNQVQQAMKNMGHKEHLNFSEAIPKGLAPLNEFSSAVPESYQQLRARDLKVIEEELEKFKDSENYNLYKNELNQISKTFEEQTSKNQSFEKLDKDLLDSFEKNFEKQDKLLKEMTRDLQMKNSITDTEKLNDDFNKMFQESTKMNMPALQNNLKAEDFSQVSEQMSKELKDQDDAQKSFLSEAIIKKIVDTLFKFLKFICVTFIILFIINLFKSKAKVVTSESKLTPKEKRRFLKSRRYKTMDEEIHELYLQFNLAIKKIFYVNDEVPPPRIMFQERLTDFSKTQKSLKYFVEVFCLNFYGHKKISKKDLFQYRRAYKKLIRSLA